MLRRADKSRRASGFDARRMAEALAWIGGIEGYIIKLRPELLKKMSLPISERFLN
ncbi:MAG TPA: hypothetical protein VF181_02325 [Balneolaceae bacterium]